MKLYRTCVGSVLLYASEAWPAPWETIMKRLHGVEIRAVMMMMRCDFTTDTREKILRRADELGLRMMFIKRKARCFAHIRAQSLLEARSVVGSTLEYSKNSFAQFLPMEWEHAKVDAENRIDWNKWVKEWKHEEFFAADGKRNVIQMRLADAIP